MKRIYLNAVRTGSFFLTLGAGFCWLYRPPAPAGTAAAVREIQVPVETIRPMEHAPGFPRMEGSALREVAGFDAAAALQRLRSTLTDQIHTKRPGITLRATPETWLVVGGFSQPEMEAMILASQALADDGEGNSLVAVLFEQLATMNPVRALELARRLPAPSTSATLTRLLPFWGSRDAASARQWYDDWQAGGAAALPEVAKALQEFAVRPVPAPPPTEGLDEALAAYQKARELREPGRFSSRDAGPVLAWARRSGQWQSALDTTGDPPLRVLLHGEWAAADPVAWLAWMRSHPREGKVPQSGQGRSLERREILGQALSRILQKSPTGPASYPLGPQLDGIAALLEEEGADFSNEFGGAGVFLNRGFPTWLEAKPAEASGWVKRNLAKPWIQPVITLLATHLAKDDPLSAFAWAAEIKNEADRRRTFNQVQGIWRTLDPAAADAWAAEHSAELVPPVN